MAVLDTSALIDILGGTEEGMLLKKRYPEEAWSTTTISLNEFLIGINEKQAREVMPFFNSLDIFSFDKEAALRSVEVERDLGKRGKMIGKLDILIAAICLSKNQPIITGDKGFFNVKGLVVYAV